MFLTLSYQVADAKHDDGQGKKRRSDKKREYKRPRFITCLSHRKEIILLEAKETFSRAYGRLVLWGMDHWSEISFTFPLQDKDGQPILQSDGAPKTQVTSAHYLANWLSSKVDLSDLPLHSKLKNGARNQAAETLLDQYKLRLIENKAPQKLTGKVGAVVNIRTATEIEQSADQALEIIKTGLTDFQDATGEREKAALALLSKRQKPLSLPLLFSGPSDFLLFRHKRSGMLFVCLPLLERGSRRANHPADEPMGESGADNLIPLRPFEEAKIPHSSLWFFLPLKPHRSNLPEQRQAEILLADPAVKPRTAELLQKDDGHWYFNIVVDVPEKQPYHPEKFLGVQCGYYRIQVALADKDGKILKEEFADLSELKSIIRQAAAQRKKRTRHSRYRGILKTWRERMVNWIVDIAADNKAAIGTVKIIGLNKRTFSGRKNLLRSHWDFGAFLETLTYKAILVGAPTISRGRNRTLFSVLSGQAMFTCSFCGAANKDLSKKDQPVRHEGTHIYCRKCKNSIDPDENAARVIAKLTREFFSKRRGGRKN